MSRNYEMFAGLNTPDGYEPLLGYELKPLERVYIIKGSPGCGKSTAMKRLASYAKSKNIETIVVRCSSDPNSYDGVIFPSLGIAVADGTSPHIIDVSHFGLREMTVNFDSCFDFSVIEFFSDRLEELFAGKDEKIKAAQGMITSYGGLLGTMNALTSKTFRYDKAAGFCDGFIKKYGGHGDGNVKIVPTDTFCKEGFVTTGSFLDSANVFCINDLFGLSEDLLSLLFAKSVMASCDINVIPSPLDCRKIIGIYYPSSDTLIKSDRRREISGARNIRMVRFTDKEKLAEIRQKLTFLNKLGNSLLDEARRFMGDSAALHEDMERIYASAVDFDRVDAITSGLRNSIFES